MDKLLHYHLKDGYLDEDDHAYITTRIAAKTVDMTNHVIVDACVKAAREAGINDLWLLDKKFVLDALLEKITWARLPMPRWISVEERLPEDHKIVLLGYIRDNFVDCGYLDTEESEWCNYESIKVKTPTHWMPLPEPPKEATP